MTIQTFVPFADFAESAFVLDYKRAGKMRVEAYQLLLACTGLEKDGTPKQEFTPAGRRRRSWADHTVGKMWLGHEGHLLWYIEAMCDDWVHRRGYKDTVRDNAHRILDIAVDQGRANPDTCFTAPWWMQDEDLYSRIQASHRAALLYKDYDFYRQYGWTEEPAYDYVWPRREATDLLDGEAA